MPPSPQQPHSNSRSSTKIELTSEVMAAIRALHRKAFHSPALAHDEARYVNMVRDSLLAFEKRYADIPFFTAGPVHSFEGMCIGGTEDRYPRHTLRLTFVRRGVKDYLVATQSEMPLGESYSSQRLLEEARHINRQLPDLPARKK